MKLTKNDIAFIAEQRTLNIKWKWLARIYGMREKSLSQTFHNRMRAGK